MEPHPLVDLQRKWSLTATSSASRALAHALSTHFSLTTLEMDPVKLFEQSGPLSQLARHEGLSLLLDWAANSPLAQTVLVVVLIPGLGGVARELHYGRGGLWQDRAEFEADLISTAFEIVSQWAGQRRSFVARSILAAVRLRLSRTIAAERRRRAKVTNAAALAVLEAPVPQSAPEVLISWSTQLTCAHRADVDLAILRLAHGYTWGELSSVAGATRRQVELRVKRGARQLLEVGTVMSTPTRTRSDMTRR